MSDGFDPLVPAADRARQAVASLRGYAYQVWASALAWAQLRGDEVLLLEIAEDFAVASVSALVMGQVKDTAASGSVTLRSDGVAAALNALWRFQEANSERTVSLVYLTTSEVGREQGLTFPGGAPGLAFWHTAHREGVGLEPLKTALAGLQLEPELQAWLSTADDEAIRTRLIRRVRWECGQPSRAELDIILDDALVLACEALQAPPSAARAVRDALVLEVLNAATVAEPEARRRTHAQFLRLVEAATSVSMPLADVRRGGSAVPIQVAVLEPLDATPLPPWWVDRAAATDLVMAGATSGTGWIYGATGSGKTTLGHAAARRSHRAWYSLDLRDFTPATVSQRLREARRELLRAPDMGGLLIDDFPISAMAGARQELRTLQALVAREAAALLITSYRAPPPGLAGDLGLADDAIVNAPNFEEAETSSMVTAAGGDAALWARPVQIFSGGGHPQLVAARIAGLRARGWLRSELLDGLVEPGGPRDVDAEREAVRLRLLEELPAAARSLLARLSLLTMPFDRELAFALASAPSPIAEPGFSLDLLAGPWLEMRPGGRYRISPLVANLGTQVMSPAEVREVQLAIVTALLCLTPFPAGSLPQLLAAALATRHREGLAFVAMAAMSDGLSPEDQSNVFYLLPLLRTDQALFDEDPGVNRLLRMAQLKIAALDDDLERLEAIYARLSLEVEGAPGEAFQRSAASYIALSATKVAMPPARWFVYLANIEAAPFNELPAEAGYTRPAPVAAGPEGDDIAGAIFMVVAARIRSIDILEALFDALDGLESERRTRYLAALATPGASNYLPVQMAWVGSAEAPDFDSRAAVERYVALQKRAEAWGDAGLAVECVRAQIVLLAEYARDDATALALLDAAEARWPDHTRLQRERSKILFRQRRFAEIVALGDSWIASLDDNDRVERVHLLREIALSAAETGDLVRAIDLLARAEAAAGTRDVMHDMAVGLAADRAFLIWRSGAKAEAIAVMRNALLATDALDVSTARGAHVVRGVSVAVRFMYQDLTAPGWDAALPSVLGLVSQTPEASEGPSPSRLTSWYQLAAVTRLLDLEPGVRAELERRKASGVIVSFELIETLQGYLDTLETGGPGVLVAGLSAFARTSAYARRQARIDPATVDPSILNVVTEVPWSGAFDPEDPDQLEFAREVVTTGAAFSHLEPRAYLAALKAVSPVPSDVAPFLAALPEAGANVPEKISAMLWALEVVHNPRPAADDLILATFRFWEWTANALVPDALAIRLGALAATGWRNVVEHARFLLRTPAVHGPAILAAATEVRDRSAIARLILAAQGGVNAPFPTRMLDAVRANVGDPTPRT